MRSEKDGIGLLAKLELIHSTFFRERHAWRFHYCLNDRLDTEEQRQSLGCCDKEDTCANDHHYLLLENLLSECKPLIINTPRKQKQPKETNWKQKFQKPQNENICLTYLNMENNGNFHFLSSGQRLISRMNSAKRTVKHAKFSNLTKYFLVKLIIFGQNKRYVDYFL